MSLPSDRKVKPEVQVDLAALAELDAQIDAKVVGEAKYDFEESYQRPVGGLSSNSLSCVYGLELHPRLTGKGFTATSMRPA